MSPTNTTPCMRPDPEDRKVTCALPRGHDVRRRPCTWMKTNRPPSRPELMTQSPKDHPLTLATPLASRGARSERDCEVSSMPGRPLEELLPRAQSLADSRMREVLRAIDFEADVAAARPAPVEDPRELFILSYKQRHPKTRARELCLILDNAEILPLPSHSRMGGGSRLWRELWDHPGSCGAIHKWLYSVWKKDT
jgi:hypothetical protein